MKQAWRAGGRTVWSAGLLWLAGLFMAFTAVAADTSNPYRMANQVAEDTLSQLQQNRDKLSSPGFREQLIDRYLMPYVDVSYAAYKVIGTALKDTTPQERGDFTTAFEQYLRRSLTEAMAKYTDQKLVAAKVREVDSGVNIVPVQLGILQNSGETINIILKMRRNNRTGDWKAFDLIAENVSILDAKSAELNPIIQQQGIGAAITALRQNEAQIGKK